MPRFRSVFISDVHLGCRYAAADSLLHFLKESTPAHLYLVGDIVDGWRLKRRWYWPPVYNLIVKRLFKLMKRGTKIYYTPGNHDEFLRDLIDDLGGIRIQDEFIHTAADGRRYLIIHGDQFDAAVRHARWLSLIGDVSYDALLVLNQWFNRLRRRVGMGYWSLSGAIKKKVKKATCFISNYEELLGKHALARGCDGVICGHIHTPKIVTLASGAIYCNAGDWVESCTGLVEHENGRLELIYRPHEVLAEPARPEDWADAATTDTLVDTLPTDLLLQLSETSMLAEHDLDDLTTAVPR
ncbi:MAG TPA: UDP-2,3-diacylglucosamine diphosphatase [Gemmatales bacterium]|nr:UDP-2,3-diacylglucosamine diphosphatase [Gemmatales bacterium]HMP59266.1 UDP-2,3-diacylglucosamine diphosphatase [Gemmatales bacterium]